MERIEFFDFNGLFKRASKMDEKEVAMLAPLIYGFEDKYFNACYNYLKDGVRENLKCGSYSIERLENMMSLSYIEAIVVLRNIEMFREDAPYIYNPIEIM